MSVGRVVLERFIEKNPLSVMVRCLSGQLMCEELDQVFEQNRSQCYEGQLKFSALAATVAEIALGTVENPNQAYMAYREELGVSKTAYYDKLNHVETAISEGVVRFSAQQSTTLLKDLGCGEWAVLPGYRCVALDGNHLQKSEKRLEVLRGLCAAGLPGTAVARYDLQSQLFTHAYLIEDAHAPESSTLDRVIEDLQARNLVLADRHFCIVDFLWKIDQRNAAFVIRQHGRLKGESIGKRRKCGHCPTGIVYEQKLQIGSGEQTLIVRRITVELSEPTRDGATEIHILSNVPAKDATAIRLAGLYHQRWEVENAFHILTMTLTCELKSLGQPRAALFLFCMAMLAYNTRQVLLGALFAEHDQDDVEQMSQFQVAKAIVGPMEGLLTAVPDQEWQSLVPQSLSGCALFLLQVSRSVDVKSYRKSGRGPKKKPPSRKRCKAGTHVSTFKLLNSKKLTP
jgi:hypothetical protein